ncbi:MAG TPA: type II 3-dehydroquinate dehydratase [Sandaracinaceae bacterium LLY-WYZ-13_1]|nr:type II 3-dehydroquinate dehydratase [Sandaracinaceae bacterium LLY-WYZ-13_1]
MARTLLRILVLHGPNLNLLGEREPAIYGRTDLETIEGDLQALGFDLGAVIDSRQSNHEGQLVDWLHLARTDFDGVLLNAAAYTHTSIAIRDAIVASETACVEVHLSNTHAREAFRHVSRLAPVCVGVVQGFGPHSYALGLRGLIDYLRAPDPGK